MLFSRPVDIEGDEMELRDRLIAIERSLWTNNALLYAAHLAPEALLVFAETGVITRDVAIAEIRRENAEGRRWERVEFKDIRCFPITADVEMLIYQVAARWAHESSTVSIFASSVYARHDGDWKLTFHQQTPSQRSNEKS